MSRSNRPARTEIAARRRADAAVRSCRVVYLRSAAGLIAIASCGRLDFATVAADATETADAAHVPLTYRAAVLADAPVAYWRLDDLDATARDELGTTDGTYKGTCAQGSAGALAGDPDAAVRFDGTSCFIQLADVFDFTGRAPFAVEAWAILDHSAIHHIYTHEVRNGAGPVDGYALLDSVSGVYLERVVGGAITSTAQIPTATGRYVHLAATYDGAAVTLYVDGTAASSATDAGSLAAIAMGAYIGLASSGFGFADNALDEIAVYDHALAPDRVALHHAIGVGGPE